MQTKLLDKIYNNKLIFKYSYMSLSLFITAIYYNLLIRPINLVTGGSGGIGVILEHLFGINPSLTIFFICAVAVVLSYFFLDKEDTVAALFIAIVYPLFISVTEGVEEIILVDSSNPFLLAIYAGFLCGVTNGMIYVTGLNTGGLGTISKIIAIRIKSTENSVNSIINYVVVIIGAFMFGITGLLYAFVYLFISKLVGERMLLGISRNKMVYIVTPNYNDVIKFLRNEMFHDTTVYDMDNDLSRRKGQKMVMTMIPTREYFVLKEGIREIDNEAFVFACDSYEVNGQDVMINSVK